MVSERKMCKEAEIPGGREPRERKLWLDFSRALAIISVVCNHALSRSFRTREGSLVEFLEMSSAGSLLKAVLYVFSRIGVPLFLMITGALLIPRDYEDHAVVKRFLKHNWWELFRTTEIWLIIMFCIKQLSPKSVLQTQGLFSALIELIKTMLFVDQDTLSSMWYMPMILCVYLMIPIISIARNKLGDKYILIVAILVFISSMIIPNINTVLHAAGYDRTIEFALSHTDLFSIYLLYVLAGFWISRGRLAHIDEKVLWLCFLVFYAGTVLFQYWIYSTPSGYFVRYADVGIILTGSAVFEIIRRKLAPKENVAGFVVFISRASFGIYFVHICIIEGLNIILSRVTDMVRFPKFMVLWLCAFFGSLAIIAVLSKVEVIKKYLFLMKER